MVFSSMVFLWIFLPITIITYYLVQERYRNILLFGASLVFYAWGEPIYILLMLASILVNWWLGLMMERFGRVRHLIFVSDVLFNVGLLGYYKYSNFFIGLLNQLLKIEIPMKEIELPIGISFFTFQILSYIIDLYRGQYKAQRSIINVALYISFFPQLIAGPIVKYKDINEQLQSRVVSTEKFVEGIRRFCYGLGKKVIIANTLAITVDYVYALDTQELAGWLVWIASIFYTLQIYYDFSGYSDMAIGLGKMFGFEFQENFLYPYTSFSIQDFWRRWHISLSSWFREYIYIPLGGNRRGKARTYLNLTIVFFVTGLWHGAGWTFILWGLYHGFFSILERFGLGKFFEKNKILGRIYTFLVVNFGWVLFRADTIQQALCFGKRMVQPWKYNSSGVVWQLLLDSKTIFLAGIAVIGSGLLQIVGKKMRIDKKWKNSYAEMLYCICILVLCIALLASNTYNPFIYFRF